MGYICPRSQGEKRLLQRGCEPLGQEEFLIFNVEFLMLDCWKVTLLRLADDTSKGWRPTTLLTRFAEELRRVGQKYEGAKDQAKC